MVVVLLEVVRRVDALQRLRRMRVLLMLVLLRAGLAKPAAAARAGWGIVVMARRMIEPTVVEWGVSNVRVCKDVQMSRRSLSPALAGKEPHSPPPPALIIVNASMPEAHTTHNPHPMYKGGEIGQGHSQKQLGPSPACRLPCPRLTHLS